MKSLLILYSHSRGKKIFRKFKDAPDVTDRAGGSIGNGQESDSEIGADMDEGVSSNLRRPLTRSTVKPRLLFPSAQQVKARETRSQYTEDEEEAVTDIESDDHMLTTPIDQVKAIGATPKAPRYAPASPPTTVRATRSRDVALSSPACPSSDDGYRVSAGSVSPFDSWARTKRGGPSNSKKRPGSPTISRGQVTKKTRG